ncbi:sulfotransferase family protein [Roseibium aggregatum]|jgi:hypothetical protein|uniref:sulfotransferase family protein n=1 Tax=Roseibium aggregatum TaxID=187304 RepID=UPI003A9825B9
MNSLIQKRIHKIKKTVSKNIILNNRSIKFKNFYDADCVAVFPEIKVCFNRIKKSGNTSVCAYLSEICRYNLENDTNTMKQQILRPQDLSILDLIKIRSYSSLVVARNPYTRALSAFLDKVAPGTNETLSQFVGHVTPTAEGFVYFLNQLVSKGMPADRHVWRQVDLLYQPIENFSFVAKLETLSTDLTVFFEQIGVHAQASQSFEEPHAIERAEAGKITNAPRKLAQYYTRASVQLVEKIYKDDFQTFGYPFGINI